ncbi:hypothetical protein HYU06_05725 [Candidatus Woesearchaeota archaeon]|nr:hypothetical protein [Candidatus Woesearchaeota archaeon]
MVVGLIAISIVLLIFDISLFFYSSNHGIRAVYNATYAWKIDLVAIIAGSYIMIISYYLYTKDYHAILLASLFSIGAVISMMHLAKWIVRAVKR